MSLRLNDRKAINLLNAAAEVIAIEIEAGGNEITEAFHTKMSWLARVREVFWQSMRRSVGSGMLGSVFRQAQHSTLSGNKG